MLIFHETCSEPLDCSLSFLDGLGHDLVWRAVAEGTPLELLMLVDATRSTIKTPKVNTFRRRPRPEYYSPDGREAWSTPPPGYCAEQTPIHVAIPATTNCNVSGDRAKWLLQTGSWRERDRVRPGSLVGQQPRMGQRTHHVRRRRSHFLVHESREWPTQDHPIRISQKRRCKDLSPVRSGMAARLLGL